MSLWHAILFDDRLFINDNISSVLYPVFVGQRNFFGLENESVVSKN